jgi:gas vesicle protein
MEVDEMSKIIEFSFGGKKKAREKDLKKKIAKSLALGAVAGSALGAISGVLFAPKSGKETRQQIKDDVTEVAKKAAIDVKDASEKAAEGIKELAGKANEYVSEKLKNRKEDVCLNEAAVSSQEASVTIEAEI